MAFRSQMVQFLLRIHNREDRARQKCSVLTIDTVNEQQTSLKLKDHHIKTKLHTISFGCRLADRLMMDRCNKEVSLDLLPRLDQLNRGMPNCHHNKCKTCDRCPLKMRGDHPSCTNFG